MQIVDAAPIGEFFTLATCCACDGKGYSAHRISVYEHGCGFPHHDIDEIKCQQCNGYGEIVIEHNGGDVLMVEEIVR